MSRFNNIRLSGQAAGLCPPAEKSVYYIFFSIFSQDETREYDVKRVLLAAYAAFFLTFAMTFIQCRTTAAPEKNEYMHPANEPAATAGVWTFTPEPITTPELADRKAHV